MEIIPGCRPLLQQCARRNFSPVIPVCFCKDLKSCDRNSAESDIGYIRSKRGTVQPGMGVCIHWTELLEWTTGMDYWTDLRTTFELFLLSMIKIAVVLLAKLNLGIWSKLSSGYIAKIQVSLKSNVIYTYPEDILISDAGL